MQIKWANIVAVHIDGKEKYVTGFGEHHMAYWNDNETAYPLTMRAAKEVCFGLNVNGFCSHIITVPKTRVGYYKNLANFE